MSYIAASSRPCKAVAERLLMEYADKPGDHDGPCPVCGKQLTFVRRQILGKGRYSAGVDTVDANQTLEIYHA